MEQDRNIMMNNVCTEIEIARKEIKNIRQECLKNKALLQKEVEKIKETLSFDNKISRKECLCSKANYSMTPIGYISSCFKNKNGIPRQPSLCPEAKGTLEIQKSVFTNPDHSLIGLDEFSHIWILFVFHENGEHNSVKAKVHPPRLNGSSVGVFSTRSPHRPCAIGLSLTKLDKIEGSTLHLSGIDLLHGTPVLDVKPYIPLYDVPSASPVDEKTCTVSESENLSNSPESPMKDENTILTESTTQCCVASYLNSPQKHLEVLFTNRALLDLAKFHAKGSHGDLCPCCHSFASTDQAQKAIANILQNDPRSVYRRQKCFDRLYYFTLAELHVTCWFDGHIAEILRVKPVSENAVQML